MKRILIANRGEIALNAIRNVREMGLESVAVYSEADAQDLHVRYADYSYSLSGSHPNVSYGSVEKITDAALKTDSQYVYPGYGFLAESSSLALECKRKGLIFIGPSPEVLEFFSNKIETMKYASKMGINTPSFSEPVLGEEVLEKAKKIGFPLLLKPVSGSGGRFILKVYSRDELLNAYKKIKHEIEVAGNTGEVYLEKYIRKCIHIEFPLLVDMSGKIVNLGERECVVQRRFQKLIAETPANWLDEKSRKEMSEAAIEIIRQSGFVGCCSVEFIVDGKGHWYFMEVNPRIQVEYALTEISYGVELIKEQIRIASGESISLDLDGFKPRFHSIECRVNAEDHTRDFRPSYGEVKEYYIPGGYGYSISSSIYRGYRMEIFYDPMILKIDCFSHDRTGAIEKLKYALDSVRIKGIRTNIPYLRKIVGDECFLKHYLKCDSDTSKYLKDRYSDKKRMQIAAIVAALENEMNDHYKSASFPGIRMKENVWNLSGKLEQIMKRSL